ncbi:MAG: YfbM family protein [Blastocatellia bacterium]
MGMICALREVDEHKISALLLDPPSIHGFLAEEIGEVDLDKAWHGIHYLLTGQAEGGEEPFCYLLEGGEYIGDEDAGYGPARALLPLQVRAWADALGGLTTDDLRQRLDPAAMTKAGIYPDIWARDAAEDDTPGYLLEYFEVLQSCVTQAARENKGLIVYIC